MPFAFFDHTGDIGVHLRAPDLSSLFRDAAAAFTDSVADAARIEPRHSVLLTLESSAVDLLLVDWLNELLYRFEVEQLLVASAQVNVEHQEVPERKLGADTAEETDRGLPSGATSASVWRLHGVLTGEAFDASRHAIKVLVKAITYHALEVREDEHGWRATVVFDI